jgi:hypothetical protein
MAEGRDDLPQTVTAEPEAIRQEMAQTRAALSEVLTTLKRRLFDTVPPSTTGETTTMAKSKKKPTAKEKEQAASKLARAKGGSKEELGEEVHRQENHGGQGLRRCRQEVSRRQGLRRRQEV